MNFRAEVQLVAVLTAAAASVPGVFLVLRRMSLVADAVSHAVLPGLVLAFFATGSLTSPFLLAAAALTGLSAVALIEALRSTGLVREDAAIGLVFPAAFSAGVVLIARYASGVHLDTDSVLLGELALAPFDRLVLGGYDLGPKAAWSMGAILFLDLGFVGLLYKELKLSTIDPEQAAMLGFPPTALHYALMAAVSVTAVGAFHAVGSILVVALMIAPPAAATLLAETLGGVLAVSLGIGSASALAGYWLARWLDVSIAGSMAVCSGLAFAAAFVGAPRSGLVVRLVRRRRLRIEFATTMLLVHLLHHEDTAREEEESAVSTLERHLHWPPSLVKEVLRRAGRVQLVTIDRGRARLTAAGRLRARRALMEPSKGTGPAPRA
ncbi:MAG: metal ABC transporter permease [Acidobacteria bacterium]|nr:MAG: metal ABC transporter permease [Acidobacteriota bacterium]